MSNIPLTDEYVEAEKKSLDAKTEAYLKTLSPEKRKTMERVHELVEELGKLECPYFLSIAPIEETQVWRFSKTTNAKKFPAPKAELKKMYTRGFALLRAHATTFAKANGQTITLSSPDGKAIWSVDANGEKY